MAFLRLYVFSRDVFSSRNDEKQKKKSKWHKPVTIIEKNTALFVGFISFQTRRRQAKDATRKDDKMKVSNGVFSHGVFFSVFSD